MSFSPIYPYILGSLSIGLGLHALLNPWGEYPRFGLPLESSKETGGINGKDATRQSGEIGTVSPLMYFKASREFSYGLGLIAFQYQGNDDAITTLIAICSLAGLTDAIVVWRHGGARRRGKVWGHAFAFAGLAWWSVSRFRHA
jgi:hypothetical protein